MVDCIQLIVGWCGRGRQRQSHLASVITIGYGLLLLLLLLLHSRIHRLVRIGSYSIVLEGSGAMGVIAARPVVWHLIV